MASTDSNPHKLDDALKELNPIRTGGDPGDDDDDDTDGNGGKNSRRPGLGAPRRKRPMGGWSTCSVLVLLLVAVLCACGLSVWLEMGELINATPRPPPKPCPIVSYESSMSFLSSFCNTTQSSCHNVVVGDDGTIHRQGNHTHSSGSVDDGMEACSITDLRRINWRLAYDQCSRSVHQLGLDLGDCIRVRDQKNTQLKAETQAHRLTLEQATYNGTVLSDQLRALEFRVHKADEAKHQALEELRLNRCPVGRRS
jgi:hypothetical protein